MAQNSDSATASTADTNLLALQRGGGVLAHEQLDPQFGRRYLDVELACAATTKTQNRFKCTQRLRKRNKKSNRDTFEKFTETPNQQRVHQERTNLLN